MHKTCLSRRPFIPDIIMVCQKTVARDRGLCRLTCRLLIKVLVFVSQEQKFIQEPIEINHASSMCFLPERKKITKKCPFEIRLGFLTSPSCAKLWFHLPEFTQLPNSLIPMELYNLFEWRIKNFNLCKRPSRKLVFYPFLFYSRVGWNIPSGSDANLSAFRQINWECEWMRKMEKKSIWRILIKMCLEVVWVTTNQCKDLMSNDSKHRADSDNVSSHPNSDNISRGHSIHNRPKFKTNKKWLLPLIHESY